MQRQALVALRRRLGWTQVKLAEYFEIRPQTLYKLEVGLRPIQPPIAEKAKELAMALRAKQPPPPLDRLLDLPQPSNRVEADRLGNDEKFAELQPPIAALKTG